MRQTKCSAITILKAAEILFLLDVIKSTFHGILNFHLIDKKQNHFLSIIIAPRNHKRFKSTTNTFRTVRNWDMEKIKGARNTTIRR